MWLIFEISICVQICSDHYKKMKKAVDNNHALQALSGDFWSDDIGEIDVCIGDMTMVTVVVVYIGNTQEWCALNHWNVGCED